MAGEEEIVLLSTWPSPFAMKARIALSEKGVRFEIREEVLSDKSDLLLKMNPVHKKVPVLIHDGKPVCESHIILNYIDEVWNHECPLLPSDPYERSRARFWADVADSKVVSAAGSFWYGNEETREGAKKELIEVLKLLESELGEKSYFGGERFGYVDVTFVPYYWCMLAMEKAFNFGVIRELQLPNLEGWLKRCLLRESVAATLPDHDKLGEYVLQIRKKKLEAQA